MKKIFIDCGANIGQSIELFTKKWKDYNEFEIHSFEPHPGLKNKIINIAKNLKLNNFHFHSEAISDIDGEFNFYLASNNIGSSLERGKYNINVKNNIVVKTIDLSKWISERFSKDDFIILKVDIEGSEYKVLKRLFDTNIIEYINELYFESHIGKINGLDETLVTEVNDLISKCTASKIHINSHHKLNFR